MAEGSNYVIAIILDAKDKNLKKGLQSAGHEVDDFTEKAEASGSRIQHAFTGAAIAMTFGKAIPFMKQSIKLFNQATSAASGLQSAIRASGEDWDVAHAFLKSYTEDGLVPLTQASAALKNMLAGGYGLEESMDIMRTMKDYAAYGRQGQLSMGDAIERTTQGLKAQLSSLSDNAGWTKNLKIAYDEYAASIGKSVGKLTEIEKRTAISVAIAKDGVAVLGDAAKASDELMGKLAQQEARVRKLGEAVGESLAPPLEGILDTVGPLTDGITAFAEAAPEATAALLGGAGLVAAAGALVAVLSLIGLTGAIVVGVVAGVVAIGAAVAHLVSMKRKAVERAEKFIEANRKEATNLRDLAGEYETLQKKETRTKEEEERLLELKKELIKKVPALTGLTEDQAEAYGDLAEKAEAYADQLERMNEVQITQMVVRRQALLGELQELEKLREQKTAEIAGGAPRHYPRQLFGPKEELEAYNEKYDALNAKLEELTATLVRLGAIELQGPPLPELPEMPEPGGDDDGAIKKQTEDVYGLLDAMRELTGWAMEQEGIPASLLMPPETLPEAVQWYQDYMEWIEGLRDEAAERDEERDAEALEKKREALEAYYRTAKGMLDRLAKEWDNLSDVGVRMASATRDAFGAALGTIIAGTEDTTAKLQQIWDSFLNWLWMELGRIIARLIMAAILKAFIAPASVAGDYSGPKLTEWVSPQRGGTILRPTRGFDYVPALLDGGETVLDVDLTRRVERFVSNWEAARAPVAAAGQMVPEYIDDIAMAAPGGGAANFYIYAVDAKSLRDMIRNGPLGKELAQAALLNQMPGPAVG